MAISTHTLLSLGILLLFSSYAAADSSIFSTTSPVTPLTSFNYEKQITGMRLRDVNIVLYYGKELNSSGLAVIRNYEEFAREYGRVFRIFYVDCSAQEKLCMSVGATALPKIVIFPPLPAPALNYEYNQILQGHDLKAVAGGYLPKPDITILTSSTIDEYLADKPNLPKVILFYEKEQIPFMLKAIAHTFYDTMHVGIVYSKESDIVKKYKVSKFPALIIIRRPKEKPLTYNGEITIAKVTDFLNPYSEKFVFGDRKSQMNKEEEKILKPWKKSDLPELYKESAESVCFKNTGRDCVIYVSTQEPNEDVKTLFKNLKSFYAKTGKFSFMWLDANKEEKFFKIFDMELKELPKVIILKTGSNKRMHIHNAEISEEGLKAKIEAIQLGEARFTRLSVKEFPELTSRLGAQQEKKGEESLNKKDL